MQLTGGGHYEILRPVFCNALMLGVIDSMDEPTLEKPWDPWAKIATVLAFGVAVAGLTVVICDLLHKGTKECEERFTKVQEELAGVKEFRRIAEKKELEGAALLSASQVKSAAVEKECEGLKKELENTKNSQRDTLFKLATANADLGKANEELAGVWKALVAEQREREGVQKKLDDAQQERGGLKKAMAAAEQELATGKKELEAKEKENEGMKKLLKGSRKVVHYPPPWNPDEWKKVPDRTPGIRTDGYGWPLGPGEF